MVGQMSVGICLVAMSPFVILVLVGSFKCDPSRWLKMPTRDMHNIVESKFRFGISRTMQV